MSKLIIDVESGEIIERELTAEEIAQQKADEAKMQDEEAKAEAKAKEEAEAKSALLERLGITEEEAKLLLG